MKIAIDIRSLHSGAISGVENYIINVLENLLKLDTHNSYTLFYNSFKIAPVLNLQFVNSSVIRSRIPNRLLNASLKFIGKPTFEKLIGDFDCLFLPNFNHFAVGAHKKLAVTVHDLSPIVTPEFYNIKRKLWHSFLNFKKILKRADIIFAVSEFTKHDLMQHYAISDSKIQVVYPGVDQGRFHNRLEITQLRRARNLYNLPGEYIIFMSTVEPRKNLISVIEAFEKLNPPTHLVIAGKLGWKYAKVLRKIRQSKKRSAIHYLGYVEENDKPYILALARALVYPSFYEGFGFVPLEAMSVGIPVITSAVTSLPEVVDNAAILVNPYSINDLVFGLSEVLNNTDLRTRLINKGLIQAQKFSWEKSATQILAGLESLGVRK